MRWDQVDLEAGRVHFPITKTGPFDLPLSTFLVDLLKARRACKGTRAIFGKDRPWVFPAHSASGHVAVVKPSAKELTAFADWRRVRKQYPKLADVWTPHVLRHTWNTVSQNNVAMADAHSRLLQNHALPKSGDAHKGYNHPEFEDLRASQQKMSDFLVAATRPKPKPKRKPKRAPQPKPTGNVVPFAKQAKR